MDNKKARHHLFDVDTHRRFFGRLHTAWLCPTHSRLTTPVACSCPLGCFALATKKRPPTWAERIVQELGTSAHAGCNNATLRGIYMRENSDRVGYQISR